MDRPEMALIGKMLPALEEVARLSEFGNKSKYTPNSWLEHDSPEAAKEFAQSRLNSFARHTMLALQDMTSKDDETQQHHLAAAAWNAMAILTLYKNYEWTEEEALEMPTLYPPPYRKI